MFIFKKKSWNKTEVKNSNNQGCIEKDAVTIEQNDTSFQLTNQEIPYSGIAHNYNSTLSEANANIQNSHQQVIMQISHSNGVHFGNVLNIHGDGNRRNYLPKTTTIVAMMQTEEEPGHSMINTISTHLGEGWKMIMRELGFSDGEISQAMIDHHIHGNLKEVIYQLLLNWVRNADDEIRTIGYLTKLLWQCGHRDCVYRMKDTWKNERKSGSDYSATN